MRRSTHTHARSLATGERWRRTGSRALLVLSALAVALVVSSSLYPEHYHFYSKEDRRAFAPDPWTVGTAFLLSAGESAVLCLIVCAGGGRRLWRRLLLALVVFVPWLYVVVQPIGPHVPGFLMVNALWVLSIVTGLAGALLVVASVGIWRGIRRRRGHTANV